MPLPMRENRKLKARLITRRAAWHALIILGASMPLAAAPPTDKTSLFTFTESEPAHAVDAALQAKEVQQLVTALHDVKLDVSERREAATRLIRLSTPAAIAAISKELDFSPTNGATTQKAEATTSAALADASAQRIMVQALAISSDLPPAEVATGLAELLDRADDPLLSETATALARCLDHQTKQQYVATATDSSASALRRRAAIITLGKIPTQNTARTLMQLVQPTQPDHIRSWGFEALSDLTGIADFGDDLTRWQQWWDRHRWLEQLQWLDHLNDNYARRNTRAKLAVDGVQDRILDLQRRLYRATAQAERPPLLVNMLADPSLSIRQLGIELAIERSLLDGQNPTLELRSAITARIDDPAPSVREKAAGLIMDLKDEAGADAVALRLAQPGESQVPVLRSYLRVMKRMPRKSVVARCIDLLDDPLLRPDAAGALAKSLEQNLVTDEQRATLKRTVHEQLPVPQPGAPDTPEPAMIELLGRLADPSDWPRIQAWLTSSSEAVRTPAGIAWAASDQPLSVLVSAANDVTLQRIAIEAAAKRGNDRATYLELAVHKPAQEQLAQAWLRAMETMATRVDAETVREGDRRLLSKKEPWTTRDALLTSAIDRLVPQRASTSATQPAPITLSETLQSLLLTRGELKLEHGEAAQAAGDFRLVLESDKRSDAVLDRAEPGLFHAYLAQADIDVAFKAVRAALAARPVPVKVQTQMLAVVNATALRSLQAGQLENAKKLLIEARKTFSPIFADPATEKQPGVFAELEKHAGIELPEAATTQPTTAPASATTNTTP